VYPVCYHWLVNKLVCTQFVFAYSAGCLHCCSSAQCCVSVYLVCYHCLVNKRIYTQFMLVYYVRVFVLLQTELFTVLWILFALAVC